MSKKKKDKIIIVLPIELRDREFAVAFDRHLTDTTQVFLLDLDKVQKIDPKLHEPKFPSALSMGYQLVPRPIPKVEPV